MDKGIKVNRIESVVWVILAVHFCVRLLITTLTNLGVDEAYYVLYGLFPDRSYFDHPPMVGWLIWLTTWGMAFPAELLVRLGPLLIGTFTLYVVYRIGRLIKDNTTGLVAMLLAATSFYHSIIVGVFILPDTTQSLFWLIALWCFAIFIKEKRNWALWLFGLATGFALLSKYHSVFLISGAMLYVLVVDYRKLFSWYILPVIVLPLLVFSPVVLWNVEHDMVSMGFHGARVGNDSLAIHWKCFFTEVAGQLFYNNPVNVIWMGLVLFTSRYAKGRVFKTEIVTFLLGVSIPLVGVVLVLSLFNKTLPHWSGPGYYGLILVAAYFCNGGGQGQGARTALKVLRYSIWFPVAIVAVALFQIRLGYLPMTSQHPDPKRLGAYDVTLDLYGWNQLADKFDEFVEEDRQQGRMDTNFVLITGNWFPAGHIDYYLGFRKHRPVLVDGNLYQQNQYAYTNEYRGGLTSNRDAYFLSTSRYFYQPTMDLQERYSISEPHTITVERQGKAAYYLYVWRLKPKEL